MTIEHLRKAFPESKLLYDERSLDNYSFDLTEAEPRRPSAVILADCVEDVVNAVKIASELKVSLTPRCYNLNIGGLAIPAEGGIVLNLKGMNRIVYLDAEDMIAVIEPGVTQAQMKERLQRDAPELTIGYSLAPPETSVLANCLMDGLTNLSLRYGSMAEWITGLEVVLHDGSILKTGSWAMGVAPYSRPPLPDMTGLFIGWQGTTGIVTKAAITLWPKNPFRKRLFVLFSEISSAFALMQKLCKTLLFDDIGVLSWPTGRMMLGVERPHPVKEKGEPDCFFYLDMSGLSREEIEYKIKVLKNVMKEILTKGKIPELFTVDELVEAMPQMSKFADFPTTLDFLTENSGGGLTWVGTYGPLSRIVEAAEKGMRLMAEAGFPPIIVSRAMKGGHFAVLRFVAIFDRKNGREIERVKSLNAALVRASHESGFLQYKPPLSSLQFMEEKMDPVHRYLMVKIKKLLDPAGIFNKGKWGL